MKRRIDTKYPGFCRVCNKAIDEGAEVYFEKGKGIWHLNCDKPALDVIPKQYLYVALVVIVVLLLAMAAILVIPRPSTLIVTTVTTTQAFTETRYVTVEEAITPATTETPNDKWASSDENVISYLDAKNYVGQQKTVEGTIVRTYKSSSAIFLNFHDPYQGYFFIVIFKSDWNNFDFQPEDYYRGKEVRVTGTIKMYEGSPEIIVESPSQIEVANEGS